MAKGVILVAGTTAVTLLARRLADAVVAFLLRYAAVRAALRALQSLSSSAQAQLQRLSQQRQAAAQAPASAPAQEQPRGAEQRVQRSSNGWQMPAGKQGLLDAVSDNFLDFFSEGRPQRVAPDAQDRKSASETPGVSTQVDDGALYNHARSSRDALYNGAPSVQAGQSYAASPGAGAHSQGAAAPMRNGQRPMNGSGSQSQVQAGTGARSAPPPPPPPAVNLPQQPLPQSASDLATDPGAPRRQGGSGAAQGAALPLGGAAVSHAGTGGSNGVVWRKQESADGATRRRPAWASGDAASTSNAPGQKPPQARDSGQALTFAASERAAEQTGNGSQQDVSPDMGRQHLPSYDDERLVKFQPGMPGADPWLEATSSHAKYAGMPGKAAGRR